MPFLDTKMNFVNAPNKMSTNKMVEKLYVSENYLVLNKPYDMYINSDDENEKNTVTYHIASPDSHLSSSANPIHFVQRLDYSTSGVLCIARNKTAAARACKLFEHRRTRKYYLAVVRGHVGFEMGDIEFEVGVDPSTADSCHRMTALTTPADLPACVQSRRAHTRTLVLETGYYGSDPVTVVLLKPITGRRHQLRVHCAAVGHTLLGDYTYSRAADIAPHRMFLHATRLVLPVPQEPLDIQTPEPFFSDPKFSSKWKSETCFYKYRKRSNYCVICLRTDKERRLEKPKHLKRFMQSLDQQFTYDRPYQMVCYVCERQAALAFRFRLAAQVAAHAHTLTHQLLNKPIQQNKLATAVRSGKMKSSQEDKTLPVWLKEMLDCEIKIRRQKILTQLLNTEVLIVSTNATSTPRNAETENSTPFKTAQCPRPGESQDLYVIPDEQPPTETNDLNCPLEISDDDKESIIILDDEEKEKKNPMLVIDSGKICNDLPQEPKVIQTVKTVEQLFIVTPLDPSQDSSSMNFLLHPIVIADNNITIPTLSSSIKNGKVLTEQNLQMDNPQIAYHDGVNLCFITDRNEVSISLQNLCQTEGSLESGKKRVNEIVRVIDSNEKVSRAPQLRSDRIDWEDKIPMDVISFVDDENGRDACKRARPMPEIGISNVTSLKEPQSDVIDLC